MRHGRERTPTASAFDQRRARRVVSWRIRSTARPTVQRVFELIGWRADGPYRRGGGAVPRMVPPPRPAPPPRRSSWRERGGGRGAGRTSLEPVYDKAPITPPWRRALVCPAT